MRRTAVMRYILPSLRERRRYLLFELLSEREIDKRAFVQELLGSIYSLYGDLGMSKIKVRLIMYRASEERAVGILRCAHDKVEEIRAALACIHSITGTRVGIRVIKTSGTIRGAGRARASSGVRYHALS